MPWTRRKNIFRHSLFGDKIIKNSKAKFRMKYDFTIIPRKAKFIIEYTWSVNNLNKKIPDLVEGLLQDVLTMWMFWKILSDGVWKSPSKDVRKNLFFVVHSWIKSVNICSLSSDLTFLKWYDWFFKTQMKEDLMQYESSY